MLNVIYDYQVFAWQKYGGISRYICQLAERVNSLDGFNARIVAPIYANKYLRQCSPGLVTGVHRSTIPFSSSIQKRANPWICKKILKRSNPQIVHETYYSQVRLAPRASTVVLTVHDMIHERFPELFPPDEYMQQIKAHAVGRADHIICISESTKKDLLDLLNVEESKITVTHLASSLSAGIPGAGDKFKALGSYILYVGDRAAKYKNFNGLIRAYAHSGSLRDDFGIVCFGGGKLSHNEKQLMSELSIPEWKVIQLAGEDSLLAELYSQASIFVCPSFYEGFGIPLLEAMSCGCPVACSNTSSLPEVAGNAAEYFDPLDYTSLLSAMERVVYSSSRTKELIAAGSARVGEFSWEKTAERTAAIYLSLNGGISA
jgi:glycosyltransferase involved in cell wall biosynthesis